jgi:endo-beta-N-acetylglucosaminidase D
MNRTATQHTALQQAKANILAMYKLSEEAYQEMIFEYGCQFAERIAQGNENQYQYITQNADAKFWNWWIYRWIADDQLLLQCNVLSENNYSNFKIDLVEKPTYQQEYITYASH